MAYIPRAEVVLKMKESGLVPVFYHPCIETCKSTVKACYDGGLRVFEFTNRAEFAHEVFSELSKYVTNELPGMLLGAGSIIDSATAALYIQMGAKFIVSPVVDKETAIVCNKRNVMWTPGCGSVSEILQAQSLGADLVKIFPGAQVGGPNFVAAVKGPMPWTMIMPTGGVAPKMDNLREWFNAGVSCVGMGSKLFPKDWIDKEEYQNISALINNTLAMIKEVRKPLIKS